MIPITAILVSVVVIPESLSSSSSLVAVFGKSKELSIHTLIATANGVSSDNAALHIPLLNFFLCINNNKKNSKGSKKRREFSVFCFVLP
jgi:hypothetical protein